MLHFKLRRAVTCKRTKWHGNHYAHEGGQEEFNSLALLTKKKQNKKKPVGTGGAGKAEDECHRDQEVKDKSQRK